MSRDSIDEVADFIRIGARNIDSRMREVALSMVLDSLFSDKSYDEESSSSKDGHFRFIEECISCSDFNPNYVWRGDSILHILLKHDDPLTSPSGCPMFDSSIELLVQRGARIDEKVLHSSLKATLFGGTIVLRHYLNPGNVNTKLANGDTLLHEVLKNLTRGSEFIIAVLMSRGARYDIPDAEGNTALGLVLAQDSFTNGGDAIVKAYMSRSDFNPDTIVNRTTGETLLHVLVEIYGTEVLVRDLIARGARVDIPDAKGKTALEVALTPGAYKNSGQVLVKAYMARSDFNPDAIIKARTGETLLHAILERNSDELVRELLARGARVDIPDAAGNTALDLSVTWRYTSTNKLTDRGIEIIKKHLSQESVDVNATILKEGRTLLHAILERNSDELVRELLARGARVDIPDAKGKTALGLVLSQQSEGKISESGRELLAFKTQQEAKISAKAAASKQSSEDDFPIKRARLATDEHDGEGRDPSAAASHIDPASAAAAVAGSTEIAGDHQDFFA